MIRNGMAQAMKLTIPVIALELPSYSRKENQRFRNILPDCQGLSRSGIPPAPHRARQGSVSQSEPVLVERYSFRHRDDTVDREDSGRARIDKRSRRWGRRGRILDGLAMPIKYRVMYPECRYCSALEQKTFNRRSPPRRSPIGGATLDFISKSLRSQVSMQPPALIWPKRGCRGAARSTRRNLTGSAFIFGDATHAIVAARVARDEFTAVPSGCQPRIRAHPRRCCCRTWRQPLPTTTWKSKTLSLLRTPELVLGT
jgi:light-independent protochlorophyllide reductase subunit B